MGARRVIGVLYPGEMGAAVGGCLSGAGHRVVWASAGRSAATAARAGSAGLRDVGTVAELARQADVILSVCPPHAALEVARSAAGFRGVYVDANAVSPASAREVAEVVTAAGASFVDGGIIGPPPGSPGTTRLYLSGAGAAGVAALFAGTPLAAVAVGEEWGQASALKMAYAAWTKGTAALLLAIRALARAEAVEEALLAEWRMSQPALPGRCESAATSAAAKAWRWISEMEEIAAAMSAHGLPAGFGEAAAAIYRQTPRETAPGGEALARVVGALLSGD
jgi:3-hydroxyisobutyrate dehydrogenase-like beta-hydroxyacid dehydrogenase